MKTYLKVSECESGKQYRCRYSGKLVLAMMMREKNYLTGRMGRSFEYVDRLRFRYWNTVTETFMLMDVIDDQLSATYPPKNDH